MFKNLTKIRVGLNLGLILGLSLAPNLQAKESKESVSKISVDLQQKSPVIINDRELMKNYPKRLGEVLSKYENISSDDLAPQLEREKASIAIPQKKQGVLDDIYGSSVNSVCILSAVSKSEKKSSWYRSGGATCWVLTADGVMVTNHHFFKDRKAEGYGILTRDGHVAPVTEILATNKDADIVIFKVAEREGGYEPLAMGDAQKVGGNAHIIAHPDHRFFTYTSGKVSRYYASRSRKKCYYMGVTAEYALGSSGGPVLDDEGNVIGMVASTNSIYYPSKDPKNKQGNFQMIIRNCVPVDTIRKMVADSNK